MINWVDNARGIACLMVILLHAAAPTAIAFYSTTPTDWMVANWIDAYCRACVPVFFVISGLLYFRRPDQPIEKRLLRLVAPLVFYTLIAAVVLVIEHNNSPAVAIAKIATRPAYYHLWFFFALLLTQMVLSIVRIDGVDPKTGLLVCIGLIGLFSSGTQSIWNHVFLGTSFISLGPMACYILYALAGGFIGRLNVAVPPAKLLTASLITFLLSGALIAFGTHQISTEADQLVEHYYSYSGLPVVLATFSLLAILRVACDQRRFLAPISKYSLGLYGIHGFVVLMVLNVIPTADGYAAPRIILAAVSTLVISWLVVRIIAVVDRKGLVV